ncbi:MAG: dynamin family protein, partial [Candidatus Heimdallarchaeota archaeon]
MSQVRGYDKVKEKRKELVGLIDTQLNILDTLNMSAWHEKVQELKDRVLTDSFKVLVVGEFKRGKSTFINAMLGQEVLPAYATPTTAIINEVKWGEHPKALLYPRGEKDAPPRSPKEVPFDKIEDYVVIKDDQTEKQAIHENPYEKAELFWPLDLCRNGIEIIDSPGLNEHDVRQKVTLDYLRNVDVVLFVISCTAPVSKSEVDVIDNIIIPAGHQDIFFICNRFDEVRRPKDKERVKNYCRSNLGSRTKSADYIFFISAADALDGRLDDDKEMLKQSGLLDVEVKLEHFLANERGRIKIVQPAIDLKYAVRESRKSVSQQSEGLKTSLDEVKKRHTKVQNSLHELKYKQNQIILKIKNFRDDLRMKIEHEGGKFYEETSNKVTEWVEDYQPQTSLGMIKVLSQK